MVYGPLRNNLGMNRVRVAYTAGEAIGPDLFTFYRSIGVNLKQLYGSTETAVFVCLQPDHEARADTVGVPIAGVEIKLADNGEILVKSPGLLKGYYKNDSATAEVLTADGWYHTSDAGFIDAQGHLKIIDRVKDVGRIRGGANDGAMFAPKYVENKLKFFPHIKEVVAYGDGRDKVCVMVNIDVDAVGNWAERRNLPYAGYTDLAQKPEVYQLIQECVEKVNADLSRDTLLAGSQVSRFPGAAQGAGCRRRRTHPHEQGAPRFHRREIPAPGGRTVRRQDRAVHRDRPSSSRTAGPAASAPH
jgi:long-chain acyl-CoA synthetase